MILRLVGWLTAGLAAMSLKLMSVIFSDFVLV
jgi:hypothetical protein